MDVLCIYYGTRVSINTEKKVTSFCTV